MRLLVTGGKGMLGRTLQRRWHEHDVAIADLPEVDVTQLPSITAAVAAARPDVVVHCAALTAVDRCESARDEAFAVNAVGSANVARACHGAGCRLVAVSTDYVFAGDLDRPYHEGDAPGPRTVYGASKLAGEEAVRARCAEHLIVRVGWLYGPGGPSFLHTMLRLGAAAGEPLRVVDDQIGNPTSTDAVAARLLDLIDAGAGGTFHLTCEGEATWFAFAGRLLALGGSPRAVVPCGTAEYPRPAPRPANSRLEKRALRLGGFAPMMRWEEAVERFFAEHPAR
jgi:dTDP-4-dehydrorhamnose reductase